MCPALCQWLMWCLSWPTVAPNYRPENWYSSLVVRPSRRGKREAVTFESGTWILELESLTTDAMRWTIRLELSCVCQQTQVVKLCLLLQQLCNVCFMKNLWYDNDHVVGFCVSFPHSNTTDLAQATGELSNGASSNEAHKRCELRVYAYIWRQNYWSASFFLSFLAYWIRGSAGWGLGRSDPTCSNTR